jgi:hypothetical protein
MRTRRRRSGTYLDGVRNQVLNLAEHGEVVLALDILRVYNIL